MFPKNLKTLLEMADALRDPANYKLLQYDQGSFQSRLVVYADGESHLILYDAQLIRYEFYNGTYMIDATYKTLPVLDGAYQLFIILAVLSDYTFPILFCTMSRKTYESYIAVLTEVINNVILADRVKVIITDYEVALKSACEDLFPEAKVCGCNPHYDRCLISKTMKLKMSQKIKEDDEKKKIFKMIMVLAYLPKI